MAGKGNRVTNKVEGVAASNGKGCYIKFSGVAKNYAGQSKGTANGISKYSLKGGK